MKRKVLKIGIDLDADVQHYPEMFQGVGKFKSKQVSLNTDKSVQPATQLLWRIPLNLIEKVEANVNLLKDV